MKDMKIGMIERSKYNPQRIVLTILAYAFGLSYVNGQTILVQPYLQSATPSSMTIKWETNTNTETIIKYGPTQDLGSGATGTSMTTLGSTILHTVTLGNLSAGTRYYYLAQTGSWQSDIFDFVTPPLQSSEQGFNIVLMSDMQKDGGNPTIFHDLINTSLLPFVATTYGTPLSDHLQMALLPGDVVDNGNSYLQFKNDFFNPGEILWRSVPSYPAIGNHEANSPNYFNYFTLPANGTPGYLEHWYSHDYSNVRVLSFDSNNPYRIQAQLTWLDSMLELSCQDTFIDFVFAQMHHPHKSELWTSGEIDYTGQILQRMETFSDSCGKPTVHFFGHTHAYSRGQSRDHDHLWVNVATSGGRIDSWGEFPNQDYEEFIVSQDEYGFVMVEVTAGDDPQFVLKRLSFGDASEPGGSEQTDLVVIKKNNNAPNTPYPLFPTTNDTVSAACVSLKGDGFFDPDGDEHGGSHWQVSTDSSNFSNPVFDSWKQYANWYGDVDLQANDDLTDESVSGLPMNQTLWWRVRYRDKSLEWSDWSVHTKFQTRTLDTLTSNLVNNPGAETGINGWTPTIGVIESLGPSECNGINPYAGQKYFAVGALCVEHPFASARQDINVAAFAGQIDSGLVMAHHGAYMADWQNTDEPAFAIHFLNSANNVIETSDTIKYRMSAWALKQNNISVPEGTRTIRFVVMGTRFAGADNDSYIDDIFLRLMSGDFSCSEYSPPGPTHNRIYVDHNAVAFPDGESWPTAYRDLKTGLTESNSDSAIDEIWIGDGTYYPTNNNARDSSFLINRGVAIYGGFEGNENLLSERNPILYPVILSGEIGNTDLTSDNSYHVVRIENITDTLLIDGLHICCGNANASNDTTGGGIYILSINTGTIVLKNNLVENNFAHLGSSIHNQAKTVLENCEILNEVMEGLTGCSILNSGTQANLTVVNSLIRQHCLICPQVIQNIEGALLKISSQVNVEKE